MAERFSCFPRQLGVPTLKFGKTSFDVLSDLLNDLNKTNKHNLDDLPKCRGSFKQKRFVEYIFLITQELGLDPTVGYHAVELLQRFLIKHVTDMLATLRTRSAAVDESKGFEDVIFDNLKDKIPLVLFSCVQLANKLSLHYQHMIDTSTAVQFLHCLGLSVSKQTLLESELMVFKGLEYRLDVLNPLTYLEVILEVLGHNEPSLPVERLYCLCHHVLLFITLDQAAIYESLLRVTTQCVSPSRQQREKFVTVTEDRMLLGVGVIAVATFILCFKKWQQVVGELSHITGITRRSISDFAQVILVHIVDTGSSAI